MNNFLATANQAKKIGLMETFMSSIQAPALLFSEPRIFFMSMFLSSMLIISLVIPLAAILIAPFVIGSISTLVIKNINHDFYTFTDIIIQGRKKYGLRIWIICLMIILPLLFLSGSCSWLYQNITNNLNLYKPVYAILGSFLFGLLWGITIVAADLMGMREKSGVLFSCADAIELIWKNIPNMFILAVNWTLGFALMYFIIASGALCANMFISHNIMVLYPIIAIFAFIVITFFFSMYIINIAIFNFQVFSNNVKQAN